MSKYNVVCLNCEKHLVIEKKMSEDYPPCPDCDGEVRRVFNQLPPVKFLGSGFYSVDSQRPTRPGSVWNANEDQTDF